MVCVWQGSEVGICGSGPQADAYLWQYMLQTAFISLDVKAAAAKACDFRAAVEELQPMSPECYAILSQASTQISNINLYDVYGTAARRTRGSFIFEQQHYIILNRIMI